MSNQYYFVQEKYRFKPAQNLKLSVVCSKTLPQVKIIQLTDKVGLDSVKKEGNDISRIEEKA